MRSVLNITITKMVYRAARNSTHFEDNGLTCPSRDANNDEGERDGFMWSQQLEGVILGAFYWLYVSENLTRNLRYHLTFNRISGNNSRAWWNSIYEIRWEIYAELGNFIDSDFYINHTCCHQLGY